MLKTTDEELHDLQSAQSRIWARRDLPNRAMMRMSHKPSQHKSQIHFESDTFIYNNILLDLAKYIH